jgi:hypothetical protein
MYLSGGSKVLWVQTIQRAQDSVAIEHEGTNQSDEVLTDRCEVASAAVVG